MSAPFETAVRLLRVVALGAVVFARAPRAAQPQRGEAPSVAAPELARIPVRIVNGRLVVNCQIAARKRIAVSLFIDYEAPFGLLLHNKAAAGIEAEAEDGTPRPITVHLPDLNIDVAQREHGDEDAYQNFTKWWSKELGESAVVGTLGSRVLSRYHVSFDLGAGLLELSAPRAASGDEPAPLAGSTDVPLTLFNDIVWFPVAYGEGRSGALALATSRYETTIDEELALELGHPAGDLGVVRVGGVELSRYVPFRPEALRHVHPDGAFGLGGLDLLRAFRIEVDRVNRRSRWTPSGAAEFASEDVEFYRARLDGRPEPVAVWLEAHPDARLAKEAAELLLDRRLEQGADLEAIKATLKWVEQTRPPDLKASSALELLGTMLQRGRAAFALAAGELGLAGGREDRYPDAVHKLHARMGSIQLAQGDRRGAWKHLLSAAFGLPDDGPLNLDLARCYELDGRYTRAYSRYLVALLSSESGPAAIEGLERVQPKLEDTESFSVDAVERLIEGRVEGFGAATKYHPEEQAASNRVVLAEYYTCAHSEGELGIVLARDGLRDHFGRDYLVQVEYHVPDPELEPLVNPLALHMCEFYAGGRPAHVIDGLINAPVAARSRDKQGVYDACKRAVTARLAKPSAYEIALDAQADAQGIQGRAEFRGPQDDDLVAQLLLVERGVLFPGKSKVVIHRMVARAALTQIVDGESFVPDAGQMTLEFERSWESMVAEAQDYLDERARAGAAVVARAAARIDPRQASVVAILRSRSSGEVVQALQLDPVLAEALK